MSPRSSADMTVVDGAKLEGLSGEPRHLRVRSLAVDPRYERPLNARRVKRIADEFDPDAVGVLYVSHRRDGTNVILDGQHRHQALLRMGWEDQLVPCYVYSGLTLEDEARIFRIMNERRTSLTAVDLFRAKIVERDPTALAVQNIISSYGLRVGIGTDAKAFRPISAAMRIYQESGADIFKQALTVARTAWGEENSAGLQADILLAVAMVLVEYGNAVKVDSLVQRLGSLPPTTLIGNARVLKQTHGGEMSRNVAAVIVSLYNKTKRSGRLQDFGQRPWRRNPLVRKEQT